MLCWARSFLRPVLFYPVTDDDAVTADGDAQRRHENVDTERLTGRLFPAFEVGADVLAPRPAVAVAAAIVGREVNMVFFLLPFALDQKGPAFLLPLDFSLQKVEQTRFRGRRFLENAQTP